MPTRWSTRVELCESEWPPVVNRSRSTKRTSIPKSTFPVPGCSFTRQDWPVHGLDPEAIDYCSNIRLIPYSPQNQVKFSNAGVFPRAGSLDLVLRIGTNRQIVERLPSIVAHLRVHGIVVENEEVDLVSPHDSIYDLIGSIIGRSFDRPGECVSSLLQNENSTSACRPATCQVGTPSRQPCRKYDW